MPIIASSALTFLDTTDHNQLSAYLSSNVSLIQTSTSNGKIYNPDWTVSPYLQIKLHAFFNQTEIDYADTKYQKTWYVQDGSDDRVPIADQGTYRTLVIKKNALGESKSGMLTYICRVKIDEVNFVEAQITYTLVGEAKNVVFSVYAPDGTIFLNQSGTIKLATNKYYGSNEITSGATFQWYKYENTDWVKISGATKDTLTVSGSDVINIASYKCEMIYKSVTYVGVITLQDKSDPYVSEIYTIGGNIFKNGVGGCAVYVIVRANGKEVDPLAGPISETCPYADEDLKENIYWYQIDNNNDKILPKRYGSDGWYVPNETTVVKEVPQDFRYTWSLMDKNGNEAKFNDGSETKTGKVIYISCNDIKEIGTLQCDVSTKD